MRVNDADVAPEILLKFAPPSVLTCHWYAGFVPVAATVKVTLPPAQPLAETG